MKYIELKNITKTFNGKTIIDNIDLNVNSGDFVILQGKNGAGKSTLLKIILGLLKPDKGEIKLCAKAPEQPSSKNRVGVVLQTVNVPEKITVSELVDLLSSYYPNSPSTKEIIHRVDLQEKQNDCASKLSGGEKQRLYFALALAGNPDLLILDEPTRNLDRSGCDNFWQQVRKCRESGITILMVTNNQSDWQELDNLVTRIITLEAGKIIEDNSIADTVVTTEANNKIDCHSQSLLRALLSQIKFEVKQWYHDILPVLGLILFSGLISYFLPSDSQVILLLFAGITSLTFAIDKVGSRIAAERIEGWENLLRVTPLSPIVYLLSKTFVPMIVIMLNLLTITSISIFKASNQINIEEWLHIFSSLFCGAIPFLILGIALGYLVKPKIFGTINGLSILVAIISCGVIMPKILYLKFLLVLSPFYHYSQLVIAAANIAPNYHWTLNILWLIWLSSIFSMVSVWAYNREQAIPS